MWKKENKSGRLRKTIISKDKKIINLREKNLKTSTFIKKILQKK